MPSSARKRRRYRRRKYIDSVNQANPDPVIDSDCTNHENQSASKQPKQPCAQIKEVSILAAPHEEPEMEEPWCALILKYTQKSISQQLKRFQQSYSCTKTITNRLQDLSWYSCFYTKTAMHKSLTYNSRNSKFRAIRQDFKNITVVLN